MKFEGLYEGVDPVTVILRDGDDPGRLKGRVSRRAGFRERKDI